MADEVKGSRRKYDGSRRRAQARETQAHIASTARQLFEQRGYIGTSISDIAEHAGVSIQTIYNAFAGKSAILARVFDIGVVGDDEPVELLARPEMLALRSATDPSEIVERWASLTTGIFVRLLPLLPAMREAAASDETLRRLWRANAVDNRYQGTLGLTRQLAALGVVAPDLDINLTADVVWALVSFDTAEALIVERRWTPDAYAEWVSRALHTLLGITTANRGERPAPKIH
jgi:AcrR family transcriptional regulator